MTKLLYSMQDAQEIVSLCRTKFLELVHSGQIATVRVGRRRMVTLAELERFVGSLVEDAA